MFLCYTTQILVPNMRTPTNTYGVAGSLFGWGHLIRQNVLLHVHNHGSNDPLSQTVFSSEYAAGICGIVSEISKSSQDMVAAELEHTVSGKEVVI